MQATKKCETVTFARSLLNFLIKIALVNVDWLIADILVRQHNNIMSAENILKSSS